MKLLSRSIIAFLVGITLSLQASADKRFYLCNVVGTGDEFDPYRPAVADYHVDYVAVIPSDVNGQPKYPWALVKVSTGNHSSLVHACDALPDFPMDGKVSGINRATTTKMKDNIKARMGGSASWVDGTDGYREVIRTIGQYLEPAFTEDNFDVQ